jgi:hypothetical protein
MEPPVRMSCCLVEATEARENGKNVIKLVPQKVTLNGEMTNISCSGCAIQGISGGNIKIDNMLKISVKLGGSGVPMLGQVVRTEKDKGGKVYRIKFLKVPPQALNTVNAFVFGYI